MEAHKVVGVAAASLLAGVGIGTWLSSRGNKTRHTSQEASRDSIGTLTSPPASPYVHSSLSAAADTLATIDHLFRLQPDKLNLIVKHFQSEITRGLASPGQTLKALPSFVTRRPTGKETGTFLALDLGGTNLRICEVVLKGNGKFRMRQRKFVISDDVKTSDAKTMFDFIANVVKEFLDENSIDGGREGQQKLHLGFTFSFPVDQKDINVGTLMHWNKGFDVKGVVGVDVVGLLREAFIRKKLNIEIVAIVNDTVGTLMAHAYTDPDTYAGVIIGTGTNAAYLEKIENIPKWKAHYGNKKVASGEMIINIEWGAFDDEKTMLPFTKYDQQLDAATENAGHQLFEKLISGLYLGEIVRYIMIDLVNSNSLFIASPSIQSTKLFHPYEFETRFMSRIERDHSHDLTDVLAVLEDLVGIRGSTLQDRQIVKRLCELVGIRAARLSAAAVAAVVLKMNKLNGCTVAIDGSVFEHYPHFRNRMYDALTELFGIIAENIHLDLARDGSGVGAALIAAVMAEEQAAKKKSSHQ